MLAASLRSLSTGVDIYIYTTMRSFVSVILLCLIRFGSCTSTQQVLANNDDDHKTCPVDTPISCTKGKTESNCCYEGENGVMLLTQLWDYDPPIGPDDVFTIHGLWPNKCKGGYEQFCNPSWKIKDAREILQSFDENELLKKMEQYWKDLSGTDSDLWLHEFNKHGTCMSTLSPKCYNSGNNKDHKNVIDYYTTVVELWESLPTFEWLRAEGISPSTEQTFNVQNFTDVLTKNLNHTGAESINLLCDNQNSLTQIYYHFKLRGAAVGGEYIPTKAVDQTTCRDGFSWLPKGSKGRRPPHGKPGEGNKGHLIPKNYDGCLISNGKWYAAQSGSCATFTVSKAKFGGIEIKSSKGPCDVNRDGQFECKKNGNTGQFTKSTNNTIVYNGNKLWAADEEPQGITQVPIYNNKENSQPIQFELEFSN